MRKGFKILSILLMGAVVLLIALSYRKIFSPQDNIQPTPMSVQQIERAANFTASFEIYTNDLKRTFTDPMYHNQSDNVFITANDPSLIHVRKQGTTWNDFFQTLPMELTKNCLVTGTKQRFCTNDKQVLRFFINGSENPDALDMEIQPQSTFIANYN